MAGWRRLRSRAPPSRWSRPRRLIARLLPDSVWLVGFITLFAALMYELRWFSVTANKKAARNDRAAFRQAG